MTPEQFNRYCAEVMGLTVDHICDQWGGLSISGMVYAPHDDMNQLAEVFDRLWQADIDNYVQFRMTITDKGIQQAMIDFIWSTRND